MVDRDGAPVRGLTNAASTYDYRLGRPGKRVLPFADHARGGEPVDVWADAGCNDLFGDLQEGGAIKEAAIATCNETVRGLFYDYEVLLDFLKVLPEDSPRYQQILTGLTDVVHLIYGGIAANADAARAVLAPLLAQRGGDPSLRVSAVGHAHMDLGWLWPIRETIRKGARTFSTAIANIEKYPDYVFGASQPQYFLWMKEHYPALWTKIVAQVKAGRIEPQGCMWVEADTNVSGGEALVRQILQGKRFFRQEFGVDVRYLWLPDVFGYTGSLPQILKNAAVDYFSTQKLSWSLINPFPHQSFYWQGIDGTRVLTHMLPEETYNSAAAPRAVQMIEKNYKDSGVSSHALMVFGIGDGGGGPGEEHLERLARIKNLAGLSPVKQEWAAAFLESWQADAARFATWSGELYLERHEGTLTTEARNKWYNRKMELALRELEWTSVLAATLTGMSYPAARLTAIWREVLLYQFHDILPGSSIKRVYDESLARYAELHRQTTELTASNDARLAATINTGRMAQPVLVQNSLSWERTEWVQARDRWVRATIPPMGYRVVDAVTGSSEAVEGLSATPTGLENDLLRVTFAEDGSIVSIFDKRAHREVIAQGERANRLAVYADLGDAWDFPMDYAEQTPQHMALVSATPRIDGPRADLGAGLRHRSLGIAPGDRLDRWQSPAGFREPLALARAQDHAAHELPGRDPRRRGDVRHPVRPHPPDDPSQHHLGSGARRGRGAQMGRSVAGRHRRGAAERLEVRAQGQGQRARSEPAAQRALSRPASRPGCRRDARRAASCLHRPGRPRLHLRALSARGESRRGRRDPGRLRAECAAARPRGRGWRRRRADLGLLPGSGCPQRDRRGGQEGRRRQRYHRPALRGGAQSRPRSPPLRLPHPRRGRGKSDGRRSQAADRSQRRRDAGRSGRSRSRRCG